MCPALYRFNGSRIRAEPQEPMKKTIAIDARLIGGTSTGDSTYWTGLLHGFAEVAADDDLLFISNNERPAGIPWKSSWRWLNVPSKSSRWWSLVSFPLAARSAKAGAVHVQYNLSPLVRRIGITTIHDVSFFIGPQWFGAKDRLLLQRFVPAAAQRSAKVIAVSETCRREVEHYIPSARGKVVVTPEAAAPWIEPMDRAEARSRVTALTGTDEPYLFTLGTSWARKNQALAVEIAEAWADGPKLFLGGKGRADEAPSERVLRLGYVSQADLSAFYSAAVAHVLPSLHEGFGLTVLEAMTCGCPVICGNGGALPEVAGDAGFVMSDYSAATWVSAMRSKLSGNLEPVREAGRARAAEFSWATTARLTREVYESVVNS